MVQNKFEAISLLFKKASLASLIPRFSIQDLFMIDIYDIFAADVSIYFFFSKIRLSHLGYMVITF